MGPLRLLQYLLSLPFCLFLAISSHCSSISLHECSSGSAGYSSHYSPHMSNNFPGLINPVNRSNRAAPLALLRSSSKKARSILGWLFGGGLVLCYSRPLCKEIPTCRAESPTSVNEEWRCSSVRSIHSHRPVVLRSPSLPLIAACPFAFSLQHGASTSINRSTNSVNRLVDLLILPFNSFAAIRLIDY